MEYKFYLDELEIEEPIGWADLELSMRRDDRTHGIQFEVSTGTLKFYGLAAEYLIQQKSIYGIKSTVIFTAQEFCDDLENPAEEIVGRLNFGKFKKICGSQCIVEIPLEEDSCKVVFKNKYDQKVDIDNEKAFDGVTTLADYAALGLSITLPPKALESAIDGSVSEDGFEVVVPTQSTIDSEASIMIRPSYAIERNNSIETGQLDAFSNWDSTADPEIPISPQVLLEEQTIDCFSGDFNYSSRQKATVTIDDPVADAFLIRIKHQILRWDATGNIFDDATVVAEVTLFVDIGGEALPFSFPFNSGLAGTVALAQGEGLYDVIRIDFEKDASPVLVVDVTMNYDPETFFTFSAVRECPATESDGYLIHETLSRVAEAITNNCVRVKSNYYGRIDSQPYSFDSDGCGGLRMLTSGLKIRRAPDGRFFASMKDLFEGLNPIDNIGFDIIEDEENAGKFIMRVEDVGFFYQDEEVFIIESIPEGTSEVQENMHYSRILVGYKKWEVENFNGLDEFNSTREYRTSIETVSNTLDITTALIAGSYPIEHTRIQSFADSGAADTKFDNDIFIISLKRMAYDFEVEQDNVSDAANFFDPDSIYNFRLSPLRNLMRWYKTIVAGYANINSSENKLFFSEGKGNFNAIGEIIEGAYDQLCKLEAMPISESQNLFTTHFQRAIDYTPIWQNETFAHEYPLSIKEYKSIKQNPYGYFSYQCGNGEYEKAFIKEIKFKPARGRATFVLLKKWQ